MRSTVEKAVAAKANLCGADLFGANLCGANLFGADLFGANLCGASLRGAKEIAPIYLARTSIVPETGRFTGWKLCRDNVIVCVEINESARRSNAAGRKCRAESVTVVSLSRGEVAVSIYSEKFIYRVGEVVTCGAWNEDRWTECGGGIHFYLTRIEAENHS